MKSKVCTHCNKRRLIKFFNKDKTNPSGLQKWCNKCHRVWRTDHIEWTRSHRPKDLQTYKDSQKNSHLKTKFGISLVQYKEMFEKQHGVCAICGLKEWRKVKGTICVLSVDHNHETGAVRELLCDRCNLIIARSKENPEVLKNGG